MTTDKSSTGKLYRIKDWAENYENNRTRTMKHMQWVPVKNSHDGDGYTALVDRENGAAYFGAWIAILGVASKCQDRGTLMRDNGTPHTAETISRLTRLDVGIVQKAMDVLAEPDVAWLEVIETKALAGGCQEGVRKVSGGCHTTDEEGNGMEGNGIEGNEQELSGADAPTPADADVNRPLEESPLQKPLPSAALKVSERIAESVLSLNPKTKALHGAAKDKTVHRWAQDVEKIHRIDKYEWEHIEKVLDWTLKDVFWQKNILSGGKFRDQFERLLIQSKVSIAPKPVYNGSQGMGTVKFPGDPGYIGPKEYNAMKERGEV